MILIDTNILSEMMKVSPPQQLIHWLDEQNVMSLFLSTITIAEIAYGIQILEKGKRRTSLENAFHQTVQEAFSHRILSFDEVCAHIYGKIMADRKNIGKPLNLPDGQIAAITQRHGFTLATRNERDFVYCGISILNPFELNRS